MFANTLFLNRLAQKTSGFFVTFGLIFVLCFTQQTPLDTHAHTFGIFYLRAE